MKLRLLMQARSGTSEADFRTAGYQEILPAVRAADTTIKNNTKKIANFAG